MAFSNMTDVIDSRDVIARIEELEGEDDRHKNGEGWRCECCAGEDEDPCSDCEELGELMALQSEAEGSPDWTHGEGLIRNSYFEEYAQQLAEDCGMIDKSDQWPGHCIDWEQAANELKMDYFSVDYAGVEYWIRA